MRRKFFILIFLCILLSSSTAIAKDRYLTAAFAFLSGNQYRGLSKLEQLGYIEGAFDGIMLVPVSDLKKDTQIMRIESHTDGITVGQLHAIVNKYLDEHPENWNMPMSILFYAAISNAFDPNLKKR